MRLTSVNIALPRLVEIHGEPVLTGIYKEPVDRRVWLGALTIEGDGQADLRVHGGPHQAVYSYPVEHYAYWQNWLGREALPAGTFGENFTVSGFEEENVYVGDIWRIGPTAVVQVTFPRLPCFKFAHKLGRPDILKAFLQSGRSGYYHRVLTEGEVGPGDAIMLLESDPRRVSIREILGLQRLGEGDASRVRHALTNPTLAPTIREALEDRLASLER